MKKISTTYVISDIHGRLDLLESCLTAIRRTGIDGEIIFTGDYIDRGPQSAQVVQRLIDGCGAGENWRLIRGNHEDFMIGAANGEDPSCWVSNGGIDTLMSYGYDVSESHVDWMRSLPRLLWDEKRVYTHAGVDETASLDSQKESVTQWFRYQKGANIGYNGRHVVHGHTPNVNGPELFTNRTNLDTGGVFTGRMVVGVFDQTQGAPIDLITVTA